MAADQIPKPKGHPIYGLIRNLSSRRYTVHTFAPNHGHSFETPNIKLEGTDYISGMLEQSVVAMYGKDYRKEQYGSTLSKWIDDDKSKPYMERCATKFGGTGDNMGFEQVICLVAENENKTTIAILVRRLPGGKYGAGFSLSEKGCYVYEDDNKAGDKIMRQIKKEHTDKCKYSKGGREITGEIDGIRITIPAPGEKIVVTIEDV